MEAVKKYWFWGIFISILAIFAMSHNALAVELTSDVSLVQGNFDFRMSTNNWTCYSGGTNCPNLNADQYYKSFSANSMNINNLRIEIPNRTYTNGDWIHFNFYYYIGGTPAANHSVYLGMKYNGNRYVDVVSQKVSQLTDNSGTVDVYLRVFNTFTDSNLIFVGTDGVIFQLQPPTNTNYRTAVVAGTMTVWHEKSDTDYTNTINNIGNKVDNINNSINDINDDVEEKTQQAVEDSQEAGADSSQDAQQSTTGLLNAITGAVSVITSASPTNCKINGNMGNLNIGELDLCANPAPAFVQTIGSLILILICVPLAITLFNRFISLFRSFQS